MTTSIQETLTFHRSYRKSQIKTLTGQKWWLKTFPMSGMTWFDLSGRRRPPVCACLHLTLWFSTEIASAPPRDHASSPSFLDAAGGTHEPRWLQRGGRAGARTHARTPRGGHAIFHALRRGRLCAPHAGESSYFESDPSFGQRPCSCREPWLKMTDSVVVEGYARLRDGKKVRTLTKFAGRTTFNRFPQLSVCPRSGKLGGWFCANLRL